MHGRGQDAGDISVSRAAYCWQWSRVDDFVTITDGKGLVIVRFPAGPVLQFADGSLSSINRIDSDASGDTVTLSYTSDDGLILVQRWRFDDAGIWQHAVEITDPLHRPVHSLRLYDTSSQPALDCTHLIVPGVSSSPALGSVLPQGAGFTFDAWLGRGCSMDRSVQLGQWALPVHYVAGQSSAVGLNQKGALLDKLSAGFCLGLTDLPSGDLKLSAHAGRYAIVIDYREDLWGAAEGERSTRRGAGWRWSFGDHYRTAIRAYYNDLVGAGVITPAAPSAVKTGILSRSEFNTWGAQVGSDAELGKFDQGALDRIWGQVQQVGLRPGCIIIDAKWEDKYGLLEHSAQRFPDFEQRLQDYRDAGCAIGLWAAFLRCEDPELLGLDVKHMLHGPDGQPVAKTGHDGRYYFSDVSQPEVAAVLSHRARQFARRYRPDLVKFDFGYEMPSLALAAPNDLNYAGERLLHKGLEVVVGAMRQELPDLAVMYYHLSPLLLDYIDLHSIDDVWLAGEEYHLEVNRRLYFASLLGELGVPSYGSGGYDWITITDTWFDTIASGTIGSLGSFDGDPVNSTPQPSQIAKFNGLTKLIRPNPHFHVEPLRAPRLGASTAARSSSWARYENDQLVLVALRPKHFDGSPGITDHDPVHTNIPVVVSSTNTSGLTSTTSIGIVPFGDGTVTIDTPGRTAADLTTHLDDQTTRTRHMTLSNQLHIDVTQVIDGRHVERITVALM